MSIALADATLPPLTNQDRCDRCGAAAIVRAALMGADLMFCNHHFNEYANALVDQGFGIFDKNGTELHD